MTLDLARPFRPAFSSSFIRGVMTFSESSVADRIRSESAVETMAAIAPVISTAAR